MHLRLGGDDVAQQRLRALDIDGEVVIDEEDRDLPLLSVGARLQQKQLIHYALIGSEANRVAEESGDGAKLAAVRAASSRFDGHDAKRSPAFTDFLQKTSHGLGHQVELFEIDRVPWNYRIFLERWFALLAKSIDWRVYIFECTASSIVDDHGPSGIGFAKGDGIGVARTAVATERLVGHLGDVRASHHHRNTNRADGISHAVGLGDHSCHGANTDQSNIIVAHVLRDPSFIHRLGIAIYQKNLMSRRSERLKEEHPQMRHEIARDSVVGVIEEDFHRGIAILQGAVLLSVRLRKEIGRTRNMSFPAPPTRLETFV